jgi:hypothetical protein
VLFCCSSCAITLLLLICCSLYADVNLCC